MRVVANRIYISLSFLIALIAGFIIYQDTISSHQRNVEKYKTAYQNWPQKGGVCLDWDGSISRNSYM